MNCAIHIFVVVLLEYLINYPKSQANRKPSFGFVTSGLEVCCDAKAESQAVAQELEVSCPAQAAPRAVSDGERLLRALWIMQT